MDTEIEQQEDEPPSSFRNVSEKNWKSWKWQFRNRLTSIDDIRGITGQEISSKVFLKFPMAITPYYFSLIKKYDYSDPIFSMCVPNDLELNESMFSDPLCEEKTMPVKNLVHRYKDRALMILTTICSNYCRYCVRKRSVGDEEGFLSEENFEEMIGYLKNHPEIKDVILSGGDPFTLCTSKLVEIVERVRSVKSVDIIRIGTKTPVVLPQRINLELVSLLKKFHPIFINTHFNHPNEITIESREACEKLADNGFVVGNQSVLLKDINDNKFVYEKLCRELIKMRVRPYYLFQCDIVKGVEHFRTKVSRGMEIMDHLRGRLSGLAIPQFVIDSPGGFGKIPILPNYIISQSPEKITLRNYEGKIVDYPEVL